MAQDDNAWFAAKAYGYGAGRPLCWQGWALMGAHLIAIAAGTPLLAHSRELFTAYGVIVGLLPLPLYAARTRGGWKWRWRGK